MNEPQPTRRNFLKAAGLGGIMLAVSPRATLSRHPARPPVLNVFPLYRDEAFSLPYSKRKKPTVKTGDQIRFLPELEIDGFKPISDTGHSFFNNIFLNVYEFTFRPIAKLSLPLESSLNPEAKREHEREGLPIEEADETFLVRISSDFIIGYNRWKLKDNMNVHVGQLYKGYGKDLHVGQLYKGYGRIGNHQNIALSELSCRDFSLAARLEKTIVTARIEKILDYDVYKTWYTDKQTRIYDRLGEAFCPKEAMCCGRLPYFDDFARFKTAAAPYRNRFNVLSTSAGCLLPTYRLRMC